MTTTYLMEKHIARLEHENMELQEQLREWLLLAQLQRSTQAATGLPRRAEYHRAEGGVVAG